MVQYSDMIYSDMVQTFLLLDTITNEKTVKFLQLDIFTQHPDLQVPIKMYRLGGELNSVVC